MFSLNYCRNGGISFAEITKRENRFPPLQKVLSKLQVSKISDITDDQAIYAVLLEHLINKQQQQQQQMEDTERITIRGKAAGADGHHQQQEQEYDEGEGGGDESIVIKSIVGHEEELLRDILHIRSRNGRINQRRRFCLKKSIVKGGCAALGISRLTMTVPEEDVVVAFHEYIAQRICEGQTTAGRAESATDGSSGDEKEGGEGRRRRRDGKGAENDLKDDGDDNDEEEAAAARIVRMSDRDVSAGSAHHSPRTPDVYKQHEGGHHFCGDEKEQQQQLDQQEISVASYVIDAECMTSAEFYQHFWEKAYCVFYFVGSPSHTCIECLSVLEGWAKKTIK